MRYSVVNLNSCSAKVQQKIPIISNRLKHIKNYYSALRNTKINTKKQTHKTIGIKMKIITPLVSAAVLLASSSLAIAATDTTDIQINVTKDAFVNLIGSAVGSANSFVTADVDNATVSLGDLGLDSNSAGDCDMAVSSAQGFKLVHTVDGTKDLGVYSLSYEGTTFTSGNTNTLTQSCNTVASNLDLVHPALPASVDAGTYSDTVTVTVVTQ